MTQTAGTLRQSAQSLNSAANVLLDTRTALDSVGTGLEDTDPMLVSVEGLLGKQVPEAISTAAHSLRDAQSGARTIDRALRALNILGIGYDPELPLDQSLAQTADSLEPLSPDLIQASLDLRTLRTDLGDVRRQAEQLSAGLDDMSAQLDPLADDLTKQADQLETAADEMQQAAEQSGRWAWVLAVVAEFLLGTMWLGQRVVWLMTGGRVANAS